MRNADSAPIPDLLNELNSEFEQDLQMIHTHIKSGNDYPLAVLASVSLPSSITVT